MQNQTELTPRHFIKTITIIHLGLLSAPTLFGFVAYAQAKDTFLDYSNTDDTFMLVVPIIALSGIFMGNLLFKQSLIAARKADSLQNKLAKFQTASLIKYALIEGPAFLAAVAFFQTNNLTYLYIAAILILYLYILRPTKDKIEKGLQLRGDDRDKFNRLDHPIA